MLNDHSGLSSFRCFCASGFSIVAPACLVVARSRCGRADLFVCSPLVFAKTIESRGFYDTHLVKAVLNTDYEVCVCVFLVVLQAQTAGAHGK